MGNCWHNCCQQNTQQSHNSQLLGRQKLNNGERSQLSKQSLRQVNNSIQQAQRRNNQPTSSYQLQESYYNKSPIKQIDQSTTPLSYTIKSKSNKSSERSFIKKDNNIVIQSNSNSMSRISGLRRSDQANRESKISLNSSIRLSNYELNITKHMNIISQEVNQATPNLQKLKSLITKFFKKYPQTLLIKQNKYDMAYLHSLLMNIAIQQQQAKGKVQHHYQKARQIYRHNEQIYFEEIITLINNQAEYYSSLSQKYKEMAIQLFIEALELLKRYAHVQDYRFLMIYNNIACNLCELGKYQEGNVYFHKCLERSYNCEPQLMQNVSNNIEIYKAKYYQRQQGRKKKKTESQQRKKKTESSINANNSSKLTKSKQGHNISKTYK